MQFGNTLKMVTNHLHKPTRLILILLNINLIIFSFVLVIFSTSQKGELGLPLSLLLSPPNIILVQALFTLLLGIWGLRSVDKYRQLVIFALLAGLQSIFDVSVAFSTEFLENSVTNSVQEEMASVLRTFNSNDVTLDLGRIQQELKCCGVDSYLDWDQDIPESCFIQEDLKDGVFLLQGHIFLDGCLSKVMDQLGYDRLERVGLILGVGKVFATLAAGVVANFIRQSWINGDNALI